MDRLADIGRHNRVDFEEEDMDDADDIASIERRIKSAEMPEPARKVSLKELSRLKKMPNHMPEHAMTRNYLELMTDLPWNKTSPEILDLKKSRQDLDADHYGLDKLKQRVLEYLAVRQLKNSLKGPILCFVGPPGNSIPIFQFTNILNFSAKVWAKQVSGVLLQSHWAGSFTEFLWEERVIRRVGISFTPIIYYHLLIFKFIDYIVFDLDIRGHRRTYIGSMPGRIIQGLKTVGVKNPVFLLDEIDKMVII